MSWSVGATWSRQNTSRTSARVARPRPWRRALLGAPNSVHFRLARGPGADPPSPSPSPSPRLLRLLSWRLRATARSSPIPVFCARTLGGSVRGREWSLQTSGTSGPGIRWEHEGRFGTPDEASQVSSLSVLLVVTFTAVSASTWHPALPSGDSIHCPTEADWSLSLKRRAPSGPPPSHGIGEECQRPTSWRHRHKY